MSESDLPIFKVVETQRGFQRIEYRNSPAKLKRPSPLYTYTHRHRTNDYRCAGNALSSVD